MKLVIVESPNKCATISSYLGDGYTVMASKGNVRDLATCGKDGLGIDVEHDFKTTYKIDKTKQVTVNQLKKAAKGADEVLLATDPDREGEAISWHLAQILGLDVSTTKRLAFHEITGPAIKEALENPSKINMQLVDSQETRRIYDRVIGFKLSKLLQNKIKCKSAGRVQSATLKMIVDNDRDRKNFVPTEYWVLPIKIDVNGTLVEANLHKINGENPKLDNKEATDALLKALGDEVKVKSISTETKYIQAKAPFTTSTMAQEANIKYHFSTAMTASTAQKLFEGIEHNGKHLAFITYHRTDSTAISPVFYNEQAKPYIVGTFGQEYLKPFAKAKKGANEQGAHEAIRPTDASMTPEKASAYLSPTELKLYKLIYDRAIASMMSAKVVDQTSVIFESNGVEFLATGTVTKFEGFEKVYSLDKDPNAKALPEIDSSKNYKIVEKNPEQKFTQPPAAMTEAKLVKLMEKEGIGRPSTYASTVQTLLKRSYVNNEKGNLVPTETGYKSTSFLENCFSEIVSTNYTAGMETKLDEIQDGNETKLNALKEFYFPFVEKFDDVFKNTGKDINVDIVPDKFCPKCGAPLVKRKSRYGVFLACSKFPDCNYIEKEAKTPAKETGELCPKCGKPLVERVSKGKTFVACSGFPKCRYIKGNEEAKQPVYTEADYIKPCPKCGTGHIVIKHSKRGDFLACTNYPNCKYHEYPKANKKSE